MRTCQECNKELTGRSDQKFCSVYCRSAYHYQRNRDSSDNFFRHVDRQLKTNRRILKEYNKAGKAIVRKETLLQEGFNPNFFTHYYKTQQKNIYLFCYEFGFMEKKEPNAIKYVLIQWQSYMNKPI